MIPNLFQCKYCSATFVNEKNLKRHSCKYKKRYEHITKTSRGNTAYKKYLFWLKKCGRSVKYVDEHTFIHSTHYNYFIRFMQFSREKGIPNINLYITIMAQKGIIPQHWTQDMVLEFFLETYDWDISPKKHIATSVDTILRLSEALECEPNEIFEKLDSSSMLRLIQSRKISPWLLLNSKTFKKYLATSASAKERDYINRFINPEKWKGIIDKNTKLIKDIKMILDEFDLLC